MCGVVGFIDKNYFFNQKGQYKIVKNMLRLVKHRGGDSIGIEINKNITIGHTRLSIIDETIKASQPISSDDLLLSYNGEIYNHKELRNRYLGDKTIDSHSDTVTLFELLKSQPLHKVLNMIQGMFAFSYLDIKRNELVLAIDRLTIKPLYYVDTPEYFAWASEIKAFRALPGFNFEFEDDCLAEYLTFRYIIGNNTLLKNVYKMKAGEHLTYNLGNGSFINKRYCDVYNKLGINKDVFSENLLENTVISHLMSDEPVGIQLSGGIDSSLVTIFAQKSFREKLHTFSIGLKEKKWNEFYYSDIVAKQLKTNHHKIIFSKHDFIRLFSKLTYHLDEPIVHPNTIPMYILAKEARKYTKVLLTGEGADEIFHGYNRYFGKKYNSEKDILFSNAFNDYRLVSRIIKNTKYIANREREKLLGEIDNMDSMHRIGLYDIYTYLPHVLLRQDKAGMAANIENRVPFLYGPILRSFFNTKIEIDKYGSKTILKEIALKYLPKKIVLRDKCGFGLPISDWLRDKKVLLPLVNTLKGHQLISRFFVTEEIDNLVDEHVQNIHDHSSIIFTLVSLIVWYDIFVSKNSTYNSMGSESCLGIKNNR